MALPHAPIRITLAFAFYMVDRALQECLGRRDFGRPQMEQVVSFFGGEPATCAFCGGAEVRRWDHLVAVKNGGETVLGNMVLACAACDDSKQDSPYETWLRARPSSLASPEAMQIAEHRIEKLRAYAAHFGYRPIPLVERLTSEELTLLDQLKGRDRQLKTDIEALIAAYRTRIGVQ